MRDNIEDKNIYIYIFKKEDSKRKKEKPDNIDDNEKRAVKKYEKKMKESYA